MNAPLVEVKRLVARFAECDERVVTMTRRLAELAADPLVLTDVALGLEARFDIDLHEEDVARWRTIGDMVKSVQGKTSDVEGRRLAAGA